jgi:hypothetical protein
MSPMAQIRSEPQATTENLSGHAGPPKVLHYGNELSINNITFYEFNKIDLKRNHFNPLDCPPWTEKDGRLTSGLLPYPPSPQSFETKASTP